MSCKALVVHAFEALHRSLHEPAVQRLGLAVHSVAHPLDSFRRPCVVTQMHRSVSNRTHSSWTQPTCTQRFAVPAWTAHDRLSINYSRGSLASAELQSRSPLLLHRHSLLRHPPRQVAASAALAHSTSAGDSDDGDDGMPGELHAVDTAIRANMLIFAAKLAVYFISNSSAMMAEAVHSLVDVANQMLLRVGLNKSQKRPNEIHPYGYARDQFIWPLISAVGIFCCGAGISMIHGIQGLFEARELGDLYWNFVVLGVSGVLESHSLWVAVNTLQKRAASQTMTLLEYVKTGADPAAVAVMMEDGAAVAGLFIAAGCLALCQATGHVVWDAVGSIAVSLLLGAVAVVLIQRNRKWLIGKSMPKAQEEQIMAYLLQDRVIKEVTNIKSEELGVRQYRFQADIAFDGEELARRCLDRCGRVRLFKALDAAVKRHDPHALDALLMQFAAVIVSTTGAEVDRMEREIMRLVPGTKYVDLETDRGRPSRPNTTTVTKSAMQQLQQGSGASAGAYPGSPAMAAAAADGQGWQQQDPRRPGPLDSVGDADHLADLVNYPLGSLSSFEGLDETPEWLAQLQQQQRQQGSGSGSAWGTVPAPASTQGAAAGGAVPPSRSSSSSSSIPAPATSYGVPHGEYDRLLPWESTSTPETPHGLGIRKLHLIEDTLIGDSDQVKPFCDQMYKELHGESPKRVGRAGAAAARQQAAQQDGLAGVGAGGPRASAVYVDAAATTAATSSRSQGSAAADPGAQAVKVPAATVGGANDLLLEDEEGNPPSK